MKIQPNSLTIKLDRIDLVCLIDGIGDLIITKSFLMNQLEQQKLGYYRSWVNRWCWHWNILNEYSLIELFNLYKYCKYDK